MLGLVVTAHSINHKTYHNSNILWAVVVAQLVEQLFPTTEISGLNTVIDKCHLLSALLKR